MGKKIKKKKRSSEVKSDAIREMREKIGRVESEEKELKKKGFGGGEIPERGKMIGCGTVRTTTLYILGHFHSIVILTCHVIVSRYLQERASHFLFFLLFFFYFFWAIFSVMPIS
jgi:hypothetical protein